jgi:hypothetical protein
MASIEARHWERLLNLRRLLSERLADGDTYLDLTSRNAHYFYMDRIPPVAVAASYNMVPIAQQRRAVAAMSPQPPKLALLEADNVVVDGGRLALRNPVLFRFVLDHYEPGLERGFIVGYGGHSGKGAPETKLALLDRAFAIRDLGMIPVAWGRSERSLSARMELIAKLDALRKDGPGVVADLSRLEISGRSAGLLRFELSCAGRKGKPRIAVRWWGDDSGPSEAASLVFTAKQGALIVPLDAYPRWVLLRRPRGLSIAPDEAGACEAIGVGNAALYQRKALGN